MLKCCKFGCFDKILQFERIFTAHLKSEFYETIVIYRKIVLKD